MLIPALAAIPAVAQPAEDGHPHLSYHAPGPMVTATHDADGVSEQVPTEMRWKPICGSNMAGVTEAQFATQVETYKAQAALLPVEEVDTPSPRVGLNLVYNLSGAPVGAAAAVAAVETYLENLFNDPITVTINVSWQSMGGGVLGATGSNSTTANYTTVRNGLINGQDSDDTIQDFLPASSVPVFFNGSNSTVTNVTQIIVNTAAYRAAIGAIAANPDASMAINTDFPWDYDPSNGVPNGLTCFRSVLVHETLHAMGFTSEVDGSGTTNIEILDLFRFQRTTNNPNTTALFTTTARAVWTSNRLNDCNTDIVSSEWRMADGVSDQASHWFQQSFNPATSIGIMQPAISDGVTFHPNFVRTSDLTALDAIGWDYTTIPADSTPPNPNPMTFAVPPTTQGTSSITMTASTATDTQNNTITYFFDYQGLGGLGADDSAWQASTVYTDTGLQENTAYSYCVRARDSAPAPNETTCSTPAASATTLISPPNTVVATNVDTTTLDATATGTLTNLNLGLSGVYIDWVPQGGGAPVGNSGWRQTAAAYNVTGLIPNQGYTFRAKARNQLGIETTVANSALVYTLAATPGAPILGSPTQTTMTLDVDPVNNSPQTEFSILCVSTFPTDFNWEFLYVDATGNPSFSETWRTDAQWGTTVLQGLNLNTTYQFVVYARNAELLYSGESDPASLSTTGGVVHGDCSGDNVLSPTIDTPCFVNVLLGVNLDPGSIQRCDMNADTLVDGRDIAPFVNCVVNGCP